MKIDNLFKTSKTGIVLTHLLNGKNNYSSSIAYEIKTTYSHICKLIEELGKAGLITQDKDGRIKYIKLTDKGRKVAERLVEIKELLR